MTTASPASPPANGTGVPGGHGPSRQDPTETVKVGARRGYVDDAYHFMMVASWSRLLLSIAAVYLSINVIFGLLFLAGGDCLTGARPGSFADAFFFSVQTFSTIGYGAMAPKDAYASVIVTAEAFVALLTVAMATGLMFSKFSKPTSRVLFSSRMIVGPRNGKPTLTMRMANERGNDIIEAAFRVTVLKPEISAEGEKIRRLHDLKLVRSETPMFSISFQGFHVIDEASPLFGETAASLEAGALRFVVTVTGLDSTLGQTIHARHIYHADEIVWNARFVDVLSNTPDGRLQIDYTRFHDFEPIAPG
jgi:inward rectifier potassium channel